MSPCSFLLAGTRRVVIWRVVTGTPPRLRPGVLVLLAEFIHLLLQRVDVGLEETLRYKNSEHKL